MVPQKRPEFVALRAQFRLLAIASFIIHYLFWQGAARSANVRVADDTAGAARKTTSVPSSLG